MMVASEEEEDFETTCQVFRPSRTEFSKGLLNYVEMVTAREPNISMFKVIPPDGWKPTKRRPNLDKMTIACPIKQLVRGRSVDGRSCRGSRVICSAC